MIQWLNYEMKLNCLATGSLEGRSAFSCTAHIFLMLEAPTQAGVAAAAAAGLFFSYFFASHPN